MASTEASAANIAALYAEIAKSAKNGDYAKTAKLAKKVLQESPQEAEAFQCLVVSLIQESEFGEALQAIRKKPELSKNLIFEQAYCLYRLNDSSEALKTLDSLSSLSLEAQELRAQILYRLEKYKECLDTYKDLLKKTDDEYEWERRTNLTAALASLNLTGATDNIASSLDSSTYEICYNCACQLIGKKQFVEAEAKLREAEELGRKTLEEDGYVEEDIDEELAIIRVQLGYCLQKQGRLAEAQKLYTDALKKKPSDAALIAVASHNIATLNKGWNIFDSRKKLKAAMQPEALQKMTQNQKHTIALNHALLYVIAGQLDQCEQAFKSINNTVDAQTVLVKLSMLVKSKKLPDALDYLQKVSKDHPELKTLLILARAQLLLQESKLDQVCALLVTLSAPDKYKLGIVSALLFLFMEQGQKDKAFALLKEACVWWGEDGRDSEGRKKLYAQAGTFYLQNGGAKDAAKFFEDLRKLQDTEDVRVLAQLVLAYSQFDPAKARTFASSLSAKEGNAAHGELDEDALENAPWIMGLKHVKKTKGGQDALPTPKPLSRTKKTAKKKKTKIPASASSGVQADPERWLPKRERSTYRPKRKDKRHPNRDIAKGTQGSAAAASEIYDMSAKVATNKMSPGSPVSPVSAPASAPGSSQVKKPKGPAKKKKKGGKF